MKHFKIILNIFFLAVLTLGCEVEEPINLDNSELNLQKDFKLNDPQSELARIFEEEQKVQAKPASERDFLLSQLQNEREAIIKELENIALKNNSSLKNSNSNELNINATLSIASSNMIRVGSVSASRSGSNGWTLDGFNMPTTLAKLSSSDNFGPTGTYSSQLLITHVAGTLDEATLANFDVFFIGWWQNNTFSAAELDALFDWVNAGGNLIATSDDTSHDDVVERFGYPNQNGGTDAQIIIEPNHPIFDGVFGTVSSFFGLAIKGSFLQGSASLLATNTNGSASILETSVGDGLVLLFSDVDMFSTYGTRLSPGTTISTGNDKLLGNVFAYMADNVISDADGDGIEDEFDNCPNDANADQANYDGDLEGDVCDADDDNDGCLDVDDPTPFSNLEATVDIKGCDTSVENRMTSSCGLTMSDMIDALEAGTYKNHGEFVRAMANLSNSWKESGLISGEEQGAIMSCAGSSNKD